VTIAAGIGWTAKSCPLKVPPAGHLAPPGEAFLSAIRLSREVRMRMGELAGQVGVNPKTIRYYESIGVLPEPGRKSSGYRDYDESYAGRLTFIRSGWGSPWMRSRRSLSSGSGALFARSSPSSECPR